MRATLRFSIASGLPRRLPPRPPDFALATIASDFAALTAVRRARAPQTRRRRARAPFGVRPLDESTNPTTKRGGEYRVLSMHDTPKKPLVKRNLKHRRFVEEIEMSFTATCREVDAHDGSNRRCERRFVRRLRARQCDFRDRRK
jgi:hypothetical protein